MDIDVCPVTPVVILHGILLTLEQAFSVCGIILNTLVLVAFSISQSIAVNVKLLLFNMSLSLLSISIGILGISAKDWAAVIHGYFTKTSYINLCRTFSHLCGYFVFSIILSLATLAGERIYSTATVERASQNKTSPKRIRVFLIICWVCSLFIGSASVIGQTASNRFANTSSTKNVSDWLIPAKMHRFECSCHYLSMVSHSQGTLFVIVCIAFAHILIEVVIIIAYHWIYKKNVEKLAKFSLKTSEYSLEHRFRMQENINITVSLKPIIISHAISILLQSGLIILSWFVESPLLIIYNTMLMFTIQGVYCTVHPLILIFLNRNVQCALESIVAWFYGRNRVEDEVTNELQLQSAQIGPRNVSPAESSFSGMSSVTVEPSIRRKGVKTIEYRSKPEQINIIMEQIWAGNPIKEKQAMKTCFSEEGGPKKDNEITPITYRRVTTHIKQKQTPHWSKYVLELEDIE